jgi:hypothetical protein
VSRHGSVSHTVTTSRNPSRAFSFAACALNQVPISAACTIVAPASFGSRPR